MDVEVLHDGVRWSYRQPIGRTSLWALFGLILVGGLGAAAGLSPSALALMAGLALWLLVVVVMRYPYRVEARLTDRLLIVDRWRMVGRSRASLRLDELTLVKVSDPPEQGGTGRVIVKADDQIEAFGRDQPRRHTEWFVEAVEAARQSVARREQREGREYSFLRKTPQDVDALRAPPKTES